MFAILLPAQNSAAENESRLDRSLYKRVERTRWVVYAETKSDSVVQEIYSLDSTRLARLKNGHYRVWIRHDFATTQSWNYYSTVHNYDWIIERQDVNCSAFEVMTLRRLLYRQLEDLSAEASWDWTPTMVERDWEVMVPDSHGERLVKLLCAKARALKNS